MLAEFVILASTFALSAGLTTLVLRHRKRPTPMLTRELARRYTRRAISRRPDGTLTVRREGRLVRVSTARLHDVVRADATRLDAELHHTLAEVERAFRWRSVDASPAALERLVPIPLPVHRAEVVGEDERLTLRIDETLEVAFVVEGPRSEQWVTRADEARLQLDPATLYRTSLAHLGERSDGAIVLQQGPAGQEIFIVRQGDGLDASRLLLEELWQRIGARCGQPLVLCAPTRDRVYAAPAGQPESIDRMVRHVADDWLGRPHGVSPRLWVYEDGRLQPWSTHA